jgi:hypothetical protein
MNGRRGGSNATSFYCSKDTAPTLLCVPDADEVLIDVGRE